MINYLQCYFSAENKDQAEIILKILTKEKLILGGTILDGPSFFWWKGKTIDIDYYYIMAFTTPGLKDKAIELFEKTSIEETPMVSFMDISVNKAFGNFIDNTIAQ